jgi:hypothetical protein
LQPAVLVKKTADPRSMTAAQLQRAIRKIARRLDKSASLDELDLVWATLCRLQDALAMATERARAKALAD